MGCTKTGLTGARVNLLRCGNGTVSVVRRYLLEAACSLLGCVCTKVCPCQVPWEEGRRDKGLPLELALFIGEVGLNWPLNRRCGMDLRQPNAELFKLECVEVVAVLGWRGGHHRAVTSFGYLVQRDLGTEGGRGRRVHVSQQMFH